jgi:stage V sporulation protein R
MVITMIRENDPRSNKDDIEKLEISKSLVEFDKKCQKLSRKLNLKPYNVMFWVLNYKEIMAISSRQGFPNRYPHWRWGLEFDKMRKSRILSSEIHELVINSDPSHAFLQKQNTETVQKAVIAHVYVHSDFFANNKMYTENTDAKNSIDMINKNANKIEKIMNRKDISKDEVEKWIDTVRSIEENIDQHKTYDKISKYEKPDTIKRDLKEELVKGGVSEKIADEISKNEVIEESKQENMQKDLLNLVKQNGKIYDNEKQRSVDMENWRKEIIDIIRKESYYFAPQKMTKVMNEGWASYIESLMMTGENLAESEDIFEYSKHFSKILGSQGFNPYKLGFELWNYIERRENRRQVIELLLQVEDIKIDNFFEKIDPDEVINEIKPNENLYSIKKLDKKQLLNRIDKSKLDDNINNINNFEEPWEVLNYKGLAEKNFNLPKTFLNSINHNHLKTSMIFESESLYNSIEESLSDFDYTRSWDKLREIRETHNDITFIDKFFTEEFANYNNYNIKGQDESKFNEMKESLLREFTNMGKPLITARDTNYNNSEELLLVHHYNDIGLNLDKAKKTLERIFKMWGRPVHLKTYDRKENEIKLSYNGNEHTREKI